MKSQLQNKKEQPLRVGPRVRNALVHGVKLEVRLALDGGDALTQATGRTRVLTQNEFTVLPEGTQLLTYM